MPDFKVVEDWKHIKLSIQDPEQIQAWINEVEQLYYDMIGTLPAITAGSDPAFDIAAVVTAGPGQQHWFYYNRSDYSAHFWALLNLKLCHHPNIRINTASAEFVSQQVGIPVEQRRVPDLWVLTAIYRQG
jgi:hypothetical protein